MKTILYLGLILSISLGFTGVTWQPTKAIAHEYDTERLGRICASQSLIHQRVE